MSKLIIKDVPHAHIIANGVHSTTYGTQTNWGMTFEDTYSIKYNGNYSVSIIAPAASSAYTCQYDVAFNYEPGVILATAFIIPGTSISSATRRSYINMYSVDGLSEGEMTNDTLVACEHTAYRASSANTRSTTACCTGLFYSTNKEDGGQGIIRLATSVPAGTVTTKITLGVSFLCLAHGKIKYQMDLSY